ncbi:MAG: S24/S26 family peptidase [Oliverpabstia sp.]
MIQTGNIEQCLQELGYAVVPVRGTSMWPLLKEGKTRVQVEAKEGKQVRKGDIVLYRRKDGTLVLHRIIKVEEDTFLVCGDHQWKQMEQVQENQILAVGQGFFQNGHYIDDNTWWYRIYKKFWNGNLTVRRCCLAFLRLSGLEKRSLKQL